LRRWSRPRWPALLLRTSAGLIKYWDAAAEKELATFAHVFNVYGFYESVAGMAFNGDQTRGADVVRRWLHPPVGPGLGAEAEDALRVPQQGRRRGEAHARREAAVDLGTDGEVRLWDAEAPRPGAADDQLLELEVRSGLRIDEEGRTVALSFAEWQARRKKLDEVRKKYQR